MVFNKYNFRNKFLLLLCTDSVYNFLRNGRRESLYLIFKQHTASKHAWKYHLGGRNVSSLRAQWKITPAEWEKLITELFLFFSLNRKILAAFSFFFLQLIAWKVKQRCQRNFKLLGMISAVESERAAGGEIPHLSSWALAQIRVYIGHYENPDPRPHIPLEFPVITIQQTWDMTQQFEFSNMLR